VQEEPTVRLGLTPDELVLVARKMEVLRGLTLFQRDLPDEYGLPAVLGARQALVQSVLQDLDRLQHPGRQGVQHLV
jgi:hypothetical protein